MKIRAILALLLLPVALGYRISDYTGGDVHVQPGEDVKLLLPFPDGNNCLPVAVLWVKGGKDYPEININGKYMRGGGMHRTVLEGNVVEVTLRSSVPSLLEGNSLIYCTRDPFILVEYYPPSPIKVGNYNYLTVILKNYGYSQADVKILWRFHPDLAPFFPPRTEVHVPGRKEGTAYAYTNLTVFLVSGPFVMKRSAHPEICVRYRDGVTEVDDCVGPLPTRPFLLPLLKCVEGRCYNVSNIEIKISGTSLKPGSWISQGEIGNFSELNADIRFLPLEKKNKVFGAQTNLDATVLIAVGLVLAAILPVAFK